MTWMPLHLLSMPTGKTVIIFITGLVDGQGIFVAESSLYITISRVLWAFDIQQQLGCSLEQIWETKLVGHFLIIHTELSLSDHSHSPRWASHETEGHIGKTTCPPPRETFGLAEYVPGWSDVIEQELCGSR